MPHGNCWTSSGDVKGAGPTWSQAKSLRTVGPARSGSLLLRTTRQTASSVTPAASNSDEPQHKRNAPLLLGGGAGLEGGASTPVFPPPARCPPASGTNLRPSSGIRRLLGPCHAQPNCRPVLRRAAQGPGLFALLDPDLALRQLGTMPTAGAESPRCSPCRPTSCQCIFVSIFRSMRRCRDRLRGGCPRGCSCWLPCQTCRLNARPPPQDATGFTAAGFLNKCDRKSGQVSPGFAVDLAADECELPKDDVASDPPAFAAGIVCHADMVQEVS